MFAQPCVYIHRCCVKNLLMTDRYTGGHSPLPQNATPSSWMSWGLKSNVWSKRHWVYSASHFPSPSWCFRNQSVCGRVLLGYVIKPQPAVREKKVGVRVGRPSQQEACPLAALDYQRKNPGKSRELEADIQCSEPHVSPKLCCIVFMQGSSSI